MKLLSQWKGIIWEHDILIYHNSQLESNCTINYTNGAAAKNKYPSSCNDWIIYFTVIIIKQKACKSL